jgi:hypothetical protein
MNRPDTLRSKNSQKVLKLPYKEFFPIGSTCDVRLRGLKHRDGAYVDSATVTGSLHNRRGKPVHNVPVVEFEQVAGNPGTYTGKLRVPADLTPGEDYDLVVTASADNKKIVFRVRRQAGFIVI